MDIRAKGIIHTYIQYVKLLAYHNSNSYLKLVSYVCMQTTHWIRLASQNLDFQNQ